jgi:CubicO group peptidase (beta-lactamase class C family)
MESNQTRAVVVLHKGNIVGERYQTGLGFHRDTRHLGWSMTKSIHTAVLGAAIQAGMLTLDTPLSLKDISYAHRKKLIARNGWKPLTFRDLLLMNDVMEIEENYGILADISQMLYGETNNARFASSRHGKPIDAAPSKHSAFDWYYSSGVSNIIASELRDLFETPEEYLAFPTTHLFAPIGAHSFAMEVDTEGIFTASSFSYATARDWARVGELFLANGTWGGRQVLPADFVEFVQQPHPASGGHYGGHFWLNPARVSVAEYNVLPLTQADKVRRAWMPRTLPADAYAMMGFLGQSTIIVPSADLVVVRLAYTREVAPGAPLSWSPELFYGGILECLAEEE